MKAINNCRERASEWLKSRRRTPSATSTQPPPAGWAWYLGTGITLAAAVAGITGVISYRHGLDMAHATGNTGLVAVLIPLVPDLTIAMSSLALVVASLIRAPRPFPAILALITGIGWTIVQNVAAGLDNGRGAALLAGAIPVAFVLTVELLMWLVRQRRRPQPAATSGSQQAPAPPATVEAALRQLVDLESERNLAETLGVSRDRVRKWKDQSAPTGDQPAPTPDGLVAAPVNGSAAAA